MGATIMPVYVENPFPSQTRGPSPTEHLPTHHHLRVGYTHHLKASADLLDPSAEPSCGDVKDSMQQDNASSKVLHRHPTSLQPTLKGAGARKGHPPVGPWR